MKHNPIHIFSWSLYDFANTIFAMNVVSFNFALWVTETHGADDLYYSLALSISTLVVALLVPLLGAISDRYKRRIPYLRGYTFGCVLFTILIGVAPNVTAGLIFFSIANSCFQIAIVFYDALLPQIAQKKWIGRISGIGVSLGYMGAIVGLVLIKPYVQQGGYQAAFIPSALCFLVFALPCILLIPDLSTGPARIRGIDLVRAWQKVRVTFRHARAHSNFLYFLLASFFFMNAINTIIFFMSIYVKKVVGFTIHDITLFLITSTSFAMGGAFVSGLLTDRIGALKTLKGVLLIWLLSTLCAIFAQSQLTMWFVGPLIGIALGSTWVASRTLVIKLAPPDKIGEFFGLVSLSGRFSSIIGPLVWGVTTWWLSSLGILRYRIALGMMLLFLVIGLAILRKVRVVEA